MLKSGNNHTGNDRFEGFCVDLLERVARANGFQYRIELAPEGLFGTRDPKTGQWNGLVRRLMDKVRAAGHTHTHTRARARQGEVSGEKRCCNVTSSMP